MFVSSSTRTPLFRNQNKILAICVLEVVDHAGEEEFGAAKSSAHPLRDFPQHFERRCQNPSRRLGVVTQGEGPFCRPYIPPRQTSWGKRGNLALSRFLTEISMVSLLKSPLNRGKHAIGRQSGQLVAGMNHLDARVRNATCELALRTEECRHCSRRLKR
jgi:hypothetical protein